MTLRDIPNVISIIRIALVIPITYLLYKNEYSYALVLFFIAGLSDGLDGYLAKRNNWRTRLGSILDPVADKILLVSSYVILGWLHEIPAWLVIGIIARDIIIVAGGVAYHIFIGEFDMEPSWISKANTFFQILLVLAVVFSLGAFALPGILIDSLIYIVTATIVLSGINYIWVWGRRAAATRTQAK